VRVKKRLIRTITKKPLDEIAALRHQGWMGSYTAPHRAFRKLSLTPGEICLAVLVSVGGTVGWAAALPYVARFWERILSFWLPRLWPGTAVLMVKQTIVGHWQAPVPYYEVHAGPITGWTWIAITAGSVLLFAISCRISKDTQLPYVYLLRAFCAIQWTTQAYTRILGHAFPQDASQYCSSMLLFGMMFIGVMPGTLGVAFYIFDVSIPKKIALTALTMGHLTVFIPLQYLVHACILRVSLLFLPILYFAFGPLVDVIVFIAFYSWAMTWSSTQQTHQPLASPAATAIVLPTRY
jgi:hypothetical protein